VPLSVRTIVETPFEASFTHRVLSSILRHEPELPISAFHPPAAMVCEDPLAKWAPWAAARCLGTFYWSQERVKLGQPEHLDIVHFASYGLSNIFDPLESCQVIFTEIEVRLMSSFDDVV